MKFIISIIICSLCILQIKGDKASTVAEFAKSKVNKAGYVWGASGQVLTDRTLDELYRRNPSHVDKNIVKKWMGKEVYDCSGLVMVAFKKVGISIYHGATTAWKSTHWAKSGKIASYPTNQVCILYKGDGSNMSHTGIYVGGKTFVHAAGSKEGVKKGTMPGSWTHWGIPNGLY